MKAILFFQISKSRQSPFVQLGTASPWSHCGIVIYKGGCPYVLEASGTVKLTEIKQWIDRGKGHLYKKKRVLAHWYWRIVQRYVISVF